MTDIGKVGNKFWIQFDYRLHLGSNLLIVYQYSSLVTVIITMKELTGHETLISVQIMNYGEFVDTFYNILLI